MRSSIRALVGVIVSLSMASGCAQENFIPAPNSDPNTLYMAVLLNHHAINLSTVAPYDTIHLVATPLNTLDAPLPQQSKVVFTSTDLAHVQVDSTGLVTAIGEATGVVVVASDTVGNLVHVDTAIINVVATASPPVLTTFSIHPVPPDSTNIDAQSSQIIPAYATDAGGNLISGLTVDFEVSDSSIATINRQTGTIQGLLPGAVTVYATTTAYGVTKADTLPYTVGYPLEAYINEDQTTLFDPSAVIIATGGTVSWSPYAARYVVDSLDIVFDDSTSVTADTLTGCNCGSGNIPLFADSLTSEGFVYGTFRARSFPVPGTYTYHSVRTGATGEIVVVSGSTAPSLSVTALKHARGVRHKPL